MSYPYILNGNGTLTIVIDGNSHTITSNCLNFSKVMEALRNSDWSTVKSIIDPSKEILNYGQGFISIKGSVLYWKNEPIDNSLSKRIINLYQEGFDIKPMVLFMENLEKNPSYRAVKELYSFLEHCNLPITEDGHFLAYKMVRDDYCDVRTKSVLNKPYDLMSDQEKKSLPYNAGYYNLVTIKEKNGQTVISMPRNRVDDDKERTCSDGLHFCSEGYLGKYPGERVVMLKVNPKDVVSIPVDYQYSKGRTSKYIVIDEVVSRDDSDGKNPKPFY